MTFSRSNLAPMHGGRPAAVRALVAALALFLASCTTQLAPDYDEYIVNNLAQLRESIETYYAAMPATGYSKESFPKQAAFYADSLGKIEAVKARAFLRPKPEGPVTRWLGMQQRPDNTPVFGDDVPTVANLTEAGTIIRDLRERQQADGVSAAFVKRNIEQVRIALNNAIRYEMALKR